MIGEWKLYAGAYQSSGTTTDCDRLDARFNAPADATTDNRYLWVADYGNQLVRQIDVQTGEVSDLVDFAPLGGGYGPHAVCWDGDVGLWIAGVDDDTQGNTAVNTKIWYYYMPDDDLTECDSSQTSLGRFCHWSTGGNPVSPYLSSSIIYVPRNHDVMEVFSDASTPTKCFNTVGNSYGALRIGSEFFIQDSFDTGVGARFETVHNVDIYPSGVPPEYDLDDRDSWVRHEDVGFNASHIKPSFIYDDGETFLVSNYDEVTDSDDESDPANSEYVGCYARFYEGPSHGLIGDAVYYLSSTHPHYPMGRYFVQHVSPTDYYGGFTTEANAITAQTHDLGPVLVECLGNVFLISEAQHAIYVWESTDQAVDHLPPPYDMGNAP